MNEFGGRRAPSGELARNGKPLVAAMLLGLTLSACGGGGDAPTAAASSRSTPPPTGSLPDAGNAQDSGTGLPNEGGPGDVGGLPDEGGLGSIGGLPIGPGDIGPAIVDEEEGTGSVTLSWIPPTTNEDGSSLTLTGYRIYWGRSEGNYTHSVVLDNPGLTRYVVEKLAAGTWYFVATALSGDRESGFSNVFSKTIE